MLHHQIWWHKKRNTSRFPLWKIFREPPKKILKEFSPTKMNPFRSKLWRIPQFSACNVSILVPSQDPRIAPLWVRPRCYRSEIRCVTGRFWVQRFMWKTSWMLVFTSFPNALWIVYLHLGSCGGKCRWIYHTLSIWDFRRKVRTNLQVRLQYAIDGHKNPSEVVVSVCIPRKMFQHVFFRCSTCMLTTLPEPNIAPEKRVSQKETSIPSIHFQV